MLVLVPTMVIALALLLVLVGFSVYGVGDLKLVKVLVVVIAGAVFLFYRGK